LQRAFFDEAAVQRGELGWATRTPDQLNPRPAAVSVDRPSSKELLHVWRRHDRCGDGRQRGQLRFAADDFFRMRGNFLKPRAGQFVDRRPRGKVEEVIRRVRR